MRLLAVGIVVFLSAFAGPALAQPYDFKGTTLGISLEEFRRSQHPDAISASRVVCSGDAGAARYAALTDYGPERQLPIIRCAFLTDRPDLYGRYTAPITLGGSIYRSKSHLYSFTRDADESFRLFEISATAYVGAASETLVALKARFGQPQLVEDTVRNGLGASFPRTKHLWSNGISTLELENPFLNVDDFRVVYSHNDLSERVEAALEALKGPLSSRM